MKGTGTSYGKTIKSVLAVISMLCLLLSFGAVSAGAQESVKITASSCTAERGDSVAVTIDLSGNPGIWGIILKISYNHSAMTLKSATIGSIFSDDETTLSDSYGKDPYVITAICDSLSNRTSNGTIITLNFTVAGNAAFQQYPVTVEVEQAINLNSDEIDVSAVNGGITVMECNHKNTEWRVAVAAGCDTAGNESLVCKKCGTVLETRTISATGHLQTEIRNAVAATKTAEGYTGDTYCTVCGKLVSTGTTIPKLNDNTDSSAPSGSSSVSNEPEITDGKDIVFYKDNGKALVFTSSADFSEFVRAEIDGKELNKEDYTVESGSTILTVSTDCLKRLSEGEHTVSIVSESGTASAKFTVQNEASPDTSSTAEEPSGSEPSLLPVIIIVIAVVLLAGGAAAFFVIRNRRGM